MKGKVEKVMLNYNLIMNFTGIQYLFKDISNIDLYKECIYYPDVLQYQDLLHPMLRIKGPTYFSYSTGLLLPDEQYNFLEANLFFNMTENNDEYKELLYNNRSYLICLFVYHNGQHHLPNNTHIIEYELKDSVYYATISNSGKVSTGRFKQVIKSWINNL